ncbi:MAG TPA: flagellar filament capping protein FliD, partial [Tepidisphaeraceae bacterium]|nr:flagellar filament capping protein FliD [Tepidisphaeraceae bacterium]
DGLLVTTTSGVPTALKIEDANGSAAADLNILGVATATGINGSFEKTIDVTAADTLATLQTKINNLNFGVSASIVNDGSAAAPFRLSLSTRNAGTAGRVTLDAGATSLGTQNLVDAQDAAVFVGGGDGRQSMLITAPRNTISGAIRGVTLELTGTSSQPVTVNVGRSVENVTAEVEKFVTSFNELRVEMKELTKFDPTTGERGLLLGSSAVQTIENQLFASLQTVVADNGRYRVLADVGITIQNGELTFDQEKFQAAWADDPDAVSRLFSRAGSVIDDETPLAILNAGRGVRTNDLGADLRITVKTGTAFDIDLSSASSMGDIIRLINNAAGTAFSVRLNALGTGLILTDNSTTGTSAFKVESVNGSQAAIDLGISGIGSNGTLTGRNIPTNRTADLGGVGAAIESRINRLIDPVSGVVSRQNRDIDTQTQQFQSRIKSLDKLLEAKRSRLERQFAQLESTLASLQSQQSAIGQIQTIQPIQRRNN